MKEARKYKNYLLVLLLVILAFNFVDRFALGVVLENIKSDLHLSDTQLGLLSGICFALFYSIMGVPIARLADRGNRVTIISATAALWSVAVASCGLANSFVQLMLIRVGVAVGEAGAFPSGLSLLTDYFDRSQRPRAVAIYGLSGPLSIITGYLVAGWLNGTYGWRIMFAILGAPGIILAVLAKLTLNEPRLEEAGKIPQGSCSPSRLGSGPSLLTVYSTLRGNKAFIHLLLGLSVQFFFMYGILQWQPTFFIRSFGLTSEQIGTSFALSCGIGGILGTYCGGFWASKYAARDERRQLEVVAVTLVGSAVVSSCIYVSTVKQMALVLMSCLMFAQSAINGPLFATIQSLVPEKMRAVAVSLVLLFANLVGMGLGPLAAGMLSDSLQPWAKEESLRYALFALAPGYMWAAWHMWRASKTVMRDLTEASQESQERAASDIHNKSETQGFEAK